MRRSKFVNVRAALLLLAFVFPLALGGCTLLEQMVDDYVLVQVWYDVESESENNEAVFKCSISATVTNNYIVPLTAAEVTLEIDDAVTIEGLPRNTTFVTLDMGESETIVWSVSIPVEHEDRNWDYSVSVSSPLITGVTAYGSVFVDGTNGANNRMDFTRDTWNFQNYTVNSFPVNATDFAALCYNLSDSEKAMIKERAGMKEGGQCYGMAVTSILAKTGRLSPSSLKSSASNLHEVSKNSAAKSIIASYHLTQYLSYIQAEVTIFCLKSDVERLRTLTDMAEKVENGGTPVLLCYGLEPTRPDLSASGHAVVAYGCENTNYTHNGHRYTGKILIYDSNSPEYKDVCCLYFDEEGNYTIPYLEDKGYNVQIEFVLSDLSVMDRSGIVDTKDSVYSFISARGTQDLKVMADTLQEEINALDAILPGGINGGLIVAFHGFGEDESSLNIAVKNVDGEESAVSVRPENEGDALDISIKYGGTYLSASSEKQDAVSFAPDGSVGVDGRAENFSLTVASDSGLGMLGCSSIRLTGDSGENASLAPAEEGYILSGEGLEDIEIYTEGEDGASRLEIKKAEDGDILLSAGDGVLKALSDPDGDGEFDRVVAVGESVEVESPVKNLRAELLDNRNAVMIVLAAVGLASLALVIVISTRSKY